MSILRRSTSFQLGGSSGEPDTNSKPTVYDRPVKWRSLQTSSIEPSGRNTVSLKYSPVVAQRVNRLTRLSRAAQPQMEPRRAGKCRNSPHQMKMSITARKTIKTISDDISCERTQKKRKLNALLVDQRRQEKVSRSNSKLKETTASQTTASHVWGQQDVRPPSPSLIDPSTSWTTGSPSVGDMGQNRGSPASMGLNGAQMPPDMVAGFFPGPGGPMRPPSSKPSFTGAQMVQPIPANAGRVPRGQWQPGQHMPIKDFGAGRTAVVSPHRSVSAHGANRFTANHHKMNKFGDDDTQQLHGFPASSSEGFRDTKGPDGISLAVRDASKNRDSRRKFFQLGGVEYEISEKQGCPYPGCGRSFRDMKAHMLTHQNQRPEKCPIETCEYHIKGFARKYDKNRHTLTHFKGTLVCGFCRGAGSAAEKSFNRADVFKRHLTSIHGVQQTLPENRTRKISGSTGVTDHLSVTLEKCSICTRRFSSAQYFYDHLDDCVLERVLQQYSRVEGSMEDVD